MKDQFGEKGEQATCGSEWMAAHYRAPEDAVLVAWIKREGAIPMVRGNVPQFAWTGLTTNRMFGTAQNPYDPERTTSGSSGGDGGLVGAKCVPFAIGTDIGGSVRGPAACNGIVGFKPTSQRSTQKGSIGPYPGYSAPMNAVISVAGPLCNTVEDVKLYCEGLWSEDFFKNNATVPPMAFRHKEYNEALGKKLKIGYLCWRDS